MCSLGTLNNRIRSHEIDIPIPVSYRQLLSHPIYIYIFCSSQFRPLSQALTKPYSAAHTLTHCVRVTMKVSDSRRLRDTQRTWRTRSCVRAHAHARFIMPSIYSMKTRRRESWCCTHAFKVVHARTLHMRHLKHTHTHTLAHTHSYARRSWRSLDARVYSSVYCIQRVCVCVCGSECLRLLGRTFT